MPEKNHLNYRVDSIAKWIFKITGGLSVLLLIGILLFLLINVFGIWEEISLKEFFFSTDWNPDGYHSSRWGTLSLFAGTIIIALLALIISVPLSLGIAIYLAEIASIKTREVMKPAIELIASLPSVVLGLIGLLYLGPLIAKTFHISNGYNALNASILVALTALPTIASICEDAISSVSNRYREASLALGASQWQTITQIVIPTAKSGVVAGIMLGFGRVIGETMIVLMVAGNSKAFPVSILDPVRPMTASVAIEIKEVVVGSLHWESLFAIGLYLFILTFIINLIVDIWIRKRSFN